MVLTRSAAKALDAAEGFGSDALALREAVTAKADAVWTMHRDIDAYTGASREATIAPNVDHTIEVQLVELALVRTYKQCAGSGVISMAAAQAAEVLRRAFNDVDNLNVTSGKVNQSKRGPFTAAINRLQSDRGLRMVPLEQLARQGAAKWLVDDGSWARIERSIVASYDATSDALCGGAVEDGLPGSRELVSGTVEELSTMLEKLGVFQS